MAATAPASLRLSRERCFVDKAFRRFFAPALLSSVGLALGGMVDCLVVGAKMGADGLSAISLGIPIYLFYNVLSYGFSIGGSIHYAAALAEGRADDGRAIFNSVLSFLIGVYLVTAALGLAFLTQLLSLLGADSAHSEVYAIAERYVRAQLICVPVLYCQGPFFYFVNCDDAPKLAAAAMVVSNAVDIVLNYVFVIVLGMGAEGSVWSTVIGAAFCLIICGSHIVRRRGVLRFTLTRPDFGILARCMRTGFASSVQYIYQFVTVLAVNKLLMRTSGAAGVAVFDVIYNLSLFSASVADSIGTTLQPMVSTYRAERDADAVRRTMQLSLLWGSAFSLAAAALLGAFARPLCSLFGLEGASWTLGVTALHIYLLSILPAFWNQCMIYYDQSSARVRSAFWTESLRLFICFLPLTLILGSRDVLSFWWVYPLSELGALIYVFAGMRARRRDWAERGDNIYTSYADSPLTLGAEVEAFQRRCEEWGCSAQSAYCATLVLEELCAAILEDAARNTKSDVLIKFTAILDDGGALMLHIRDNSYEFNPFELEAAGEGDALGMTFVRKKAQEFFYRRYLGFNTLVVKL